MFLDVSCIGFTWFYNVIYCSYCLDLFWVAIAIAPQSDEEMLMVANSNVPIHSRLWCVYEAGKPGSREAGKPLGCVAR